MPRKVFVIGVGMTKFEKPGNSDRDYPDMVAESAKAALADARIPYTDVEEIYAAHVYGDSTSGQRAVYGLGMTGVPVMNVNNNCATGSSALWLAARAVKGGLADCVMATGFEKMAPGSLREVWTDRESPLALHTQAMASLRGPGSPMAPWLFGAAGQEHMDRYGTTAEQFANIAHKNHKHSVNNPYAQFQQEYSLEEILAAPAITGPLTKLQCSPTSNGSATAVLAGEEFVDRHELADQAVEIVGQSVVTDMADTFDGTAAALVGVHMSRAAARQVYEQAGIGPQDIAVIELHDCFSTNELLTYEALGLCGPGEGGGLIEAGETTYGGTWVVNPSGGLISKGHPLGATGLAQCAELTWQLRGTAGARQVEGAATPAGVALAHNIGLGGAAVVTAYRSAQRGSH
ncbi:lipid-transfer protein [Streptomyces sp. NPDC057718]|uniref:lipid-transfer protein n=1 Tax=Streptomyces sp. NPDC057718 TaxID=3346225 RepID=UPI0036A4F74D